MPKIIPEMLEIGRSPRLDGAWRRTTAVDAIQACCRMLDAILNDRFPKRIARPKDLAARVERARDEFYEEVAFLFDVAACRGLQEEPTQSVYNAFLRLLESDTVHNVQGGHEHWEAWFAAHFGDFDIYRLFDEEHATAVNSDNDPNITAMFFRSYELLRRLNIIAHRLAKALDLSERTLFTYEKDGKSTAGTFWPSPVNPNDRHGKKYYDPQLVLKALIALPNDFSKKASTTEIIELLMNNKLSSKLPPKRQKKTKLETDEEAIRLEKEKLGWKDRFPT